MRLDWERYHHVPHRRLPVLPIYKAVAGCAGDGANHLLSEVLCGLFRFTSTILTLIRC
jgi:hypothetical protein